MNYETVFIPTVTRLKELVERQFGCQFDYQSLTDLVQDNLSSIRDSLKSGQPVSAGDWVFFPVFSNDELAGAARISSREALSDEEVRHLNNVVRMVLEGSLMNINRLDSLDEIEDQLQNMDQIKSQKVIPISSFQKNKFPLPSTVDVDRENLSISFLIESQSADDIFKMAVEIHHYAARYAILSLDDLNSTVLDSSEAFQSLGRATIFIKDVTALTFETQRKLVRIFKEQDENEALRLDGPQIVAGTLLPLSELKKSCKLDAELLSYLMTGYLCLSRPFEAYKKRDLLEFFFDQMSGRRNHI